jgi:hypothetical protein
MRQQCSREKPSSADRERRLTDLRKNGENISVKADNFLFYFQSKKAVDGISAVREGRASSQDLAMQIL